MKKYLLPILLAVSLLLAGCGERAGTRNDDAAPDENPHTFAGYPVVYMFRNGLY